MKTPEGVKREKISHLEYCLEKLLLKDNGYNTTEVERLYAYIYRVICEMDKMNAIDATEYYRNKIYADVRGTLMRFNIELVV